MVESKTNIIETFTTKIGTITLRTDNIIVFTLKEGVTHVDI